MKKIITVLLLVVVFTLFSGVIHAKQNTQAFYKNQDVSIKIVNDSCIIETKDCFKKVSLKQKGNKKYADGFYIKQNERTLVYHKNGTGTVLFRQ